MERALLLIAVSSLLIFSSVEATQPAISPTMLTKSDAVAMIDNNLNKIKLNAEQAVAAFDKINNDGSAKTEADVVWLTVCRFEYKTLISHVTNHAKPALEQGPLGMTTVLDTIEKAIESCQNSFESLAGDRENPVKTYENSIRDLTREAYNIHVTPIS